jgi:hypothetical protein
MRFLIFICLPLAIASCSTSGPYAKSSTVTEDNLRERPVWFWFAGDSPRRMCLQVKLDQKTIYETAFSICHELSTVSGKAQKQALHYSFTSPRPIVWQGYKDDDEITPANQKILGDVWLAGSEPDCMILGISFQGIDSNFMSTLHIANPNQRSESFITPGLTIVTTPTHE